MQGHFDLTMLHTPGLTQEAIDTARKIGGDPEVAALLRQLPKEDEWHTDNILYRTTPSYLYFRAGSNTGLYGSWSPATGYSALDVLALVNTSSEPPYNEGSAYGYLACDSIPDLVVAGAWKYFIGNCIVTPDFKVAADGREAVYAKFKFLFLPGQATSSTIRSVAIWGSGKYGSSDATAMRTRMGRVRIKDSGGNPVTITKAATKSLLVEYTFTIPTL
jgi:hypothetical protein